MGPAGGTGNALRGAVIALAALWAGLSAQSVAAQRSIAVGADGGIVLAGQLSQPQHSCGPVVFRRDCRLYPRAWPALVKLKPDGSLDTGFGFGGGVIDFRGSPFGGSFGALALDQRAGILVAGPWNDFLRFGGNGAPDSNFQGAGLSPTAILPQSDGSLIVATADQVGIKESHSSLTLSRVGPAGEPRETIGFVEGTSHEDAVALSESLQVGNSLLLAGRVGFGGAVLRFRLGAGPSPDPGFAAGKGILRPGGETKPWVTVSAIAADGDGFLIAGQRELEEPVIARYDGEGLPDRSFGDDGTLRLDQAPSRSVPAVLIVSSGGRITVVGRRQTTCPNPKPNARSATIACAKAFLRTIEPGATAAGPAIDVPLPPRGDLDAAALGDGGLLVSTIVRAGAATRFAVARLEDDGSLDSGFGNGGVAEVAPCRGSIRARRRTGCIGSAIPGLWLTDRAGRRPHGVLRVVDRNELDPIVAVRLLLPVGIEGEPAAARFVRVTSVPRGKASVEVARKRILVDPNVDARGLSIGLRPGVLRPVGSGHKLVFHVLTTFKDGSSQRSAIRLAP